MSLNGLVTFLTETPLYVNIIFDCNSKIGEKLISLKINKRKLELFKFKNEHFWQVKKKFIYKN